ncbi:MAG: hypothetical protein HY590_04485 [Candidatus Omnitrophica bacterium]|nr:hypothetical protein [Candidatus Omnitrophota bacterium]
MMGSSFVVRRSSFVFLLVGCTLFNAPAWGATQDRYERITEQLSQTIATVKALDTRKEKYDVLFRRDPMRALVDSQGNLLTSAGLHDGLGVQGIIWNEKRPLAVIEDELYAKGDVIGDYVIRDIRDDSVIVQHGDQIQRIPVDHSLNE